jgi:hypothetical protein
MNAAKSFIDDAKKYHAPLRTSQLCLFFMDQGYGQKSFVD